ncbi:hypothetical protein B0H63DRAFT_525907 [Podospora didyma]|uniref:Uncharacterized protein n=1 Tax=Podospora didyma TaxID=330526 RepID=A0AAE0N8F0_9PEZI|nr:hypothetical protein B0H63DRAFT_525907 [Podospora didyma]
MVNDTIPQESEQRNIFLGLIQEASANIPLAPPVPPSTSQPVTSAPSTRNVNSGVNATSETRGCTVTQSSTGDTAVVGSLTGTSIPLTVAPRIAPVKQRKEIPHYRRHAMRACGPPRRDWNLSRSSRGGKEEITSSMQQRQQRQQPYPHETAPTDDPAPIGNRKRKGSTSLEEDQPPASRPKSDREDSESGSAVRPVPAIRDQRWKLSSVEERRMDGQREGESIYDFGNGVKHIWV